MNKTLDTSLFDKAAQFAIQAHCGTERRDKGFPYIIRPKGCPLGTHRDDTERCHMALPQGSPSRETAAS